MCSVWHVKKELFWKLSGRLHNKTIYLVKLTFDSILQIVKYLITCVSATASEEFGFSFLLSVVSLSSSRSFNSCSISFRASLTFEYSL